MNRGIVFIAHSKAGYFYAAYNAAFSVKHHNPEIQTCLIHDGGMDKYLSRPYCRDYFDRVIEIPEEILWHDGKVDPAFIKLNIYNLSPFDETIYLDTECQAMQDLSPLFDKIKAEGGYIYSHVIGDWKKDQGNDIPHNYWAKANDIWDHFNLNDAAVLPSTNSSFQYWRRSPEADEFHYQMMENWRNRFPFDKLKVAWAKNQPDELYLNVTLAQKGLSGKLPFPVLLMGNSSSNISVRQAESTYPVLCFFGSHKQTKEYFRKWYDNNLIRWHSKKSLPHIYKWHLIAKDKITNNNRPVAPNPKYVDTVSPMTKHAEKIRLYQSFFLPENETSRKDELLKVLQRNVECDEVDFIHLLTEADLPENALPKSDKISIVKTQHRPTYNDCIREANKHADKDTITVIANADIYLDKRAGQLLKELNYKGTAYALSRWDVDAKGNSKHFAQGYSQDTWAMKGQIPEMDCDFIFGVPACDNRFAFELKKVYRRVANPSNSIKTFHLHLSTRRKYTEKDRLPGETAPVVPEGSAPYRKKRLLLIQKGKVGDILICLPIAKYLSEEYLIDWQCPAKYHSLFDYVDYVRAVDEKKSEYDRVLDLSFGQGGAPEGWWQKNRSRFSSFVEAKYELAGVPLKERWNLQYNRNEAKENALFDIIQQMTGGEPYTLVHEKSDYGTPINIQTDRYKLEFAQIENYTIFDWRKVILAAAEVHCIDSSLCNFIEVIPEAKHLNKTYHRTDRETHDWQRTITENGWKKINHLQKMEAA